MYLANGAVTGGVAIVQATKTSGAIVNVEPQEFMNVLSKTDKPVVACAKGRSFKANYQYLMSYKGFCVLYKIRRTHPSSRRHRTD